MHYACSIWTPLKLISPEQVFWTPSEKFIPTVGQPHKGKSVHGRHYVESMHVRERCWSLLLATK